jgi:hypothetical protein
VIVVDGKEDPEAANSFAVGAQRHGYDASAVKLWPQDGPIDLLQGSGEAIADRIHALSTWTEPYYESVARLAIKLAVDQPGGPPRILRELVGRLDGASLKAAWAGTDRSDVASRLTTELIAGVKMRYFSLVAALENIGAVSRTASERGWTFSDARAMWITLPTSTTPVIASGFARALLVDLIGYLRDPMRRTDERPILLVIEEMGALVGDDPVMARTLPEVLERARSANVRVILSGQTPESLGDQTMQARLLRSGTAVVAMRMPFPEPVLELLGTRARPEASLGIGIDGTHLDQGSVRLQQQFAVAPDEIRSLSVGRAILIHQGKFSQFQVPPEVAPTS